MKTLHMITVALVSLGVIATTGAYAIENYDLKQDKQMSTYILNPFTDPAWLRQVQMMDRSERDPRIEHEVFGAFFGSDSSGEHMDRTIDK